MCERAELLAWAPLQGFGIEAVPLPAEVPKIFSALPEYVITTDRTLPRSLALALALALTLT